MPAQPDPVPPGPDEIDRGLREIIAGHGGESAVREPSAAERASQQARQPKRPASRPAKRNRAPGWRNARKARELRKPVPEPGPRPRRPRLTRGRRNSARRGQTAAQRQSMRRRRARTVAIRLGVLVAFGCLLFGLHLLGFGPH